MKKQDTRPQEESGTEAELKPTRRAVLGAAGALAVPAAARPATAGADDTRSERTQRSRYEGVWVDMQFGGVVEDAALTLRNCPDYDDEPDAPAESDGIEIQPAADESDVDLDTETQSVLDELRDLDVNETPPVELMAKVQQWQDELDDE